MKICARVKLEGYRFAALTYLESDDASPYAAGVFRSAIIVVKNTA